MKKVTLQEYANLISENIGQVETLQEIQDYAEDNLDTTLWDYPIDEENDLIENGNTNTIIVITEFGERICELL